MNLCLRGSSNIQDTLPINTDQVPSNESMEAMGHNFFTPQPVKGHTYAHGKRESRAEP